MKKLSLTIGIPTYNGGPYLEATLKSIFSQSFKDFDIVINDDCSTDNTLKIIKKFPQRVIKIFKNKTNLGYGYNLQLLKKHIKADLLFLMGQDDILLKDALKKVYEAFFYNENIGAVIRPYYWFNKNWQKPVRLVKPYNNQENKIISISGPKKAIEKVFEAAGQLSGLAFRTKFLKTNFHSEIFVSHVYPLASIFKEHPLMFLKDYTVAVRIESSQTRHFSKIYDISPTQSWVKMFQNIYFEKKYEKIRILGIKKITTHFVGLVQIKNFSSSKNLLREIFYLLKYNPWNFLNFKFWFFSLAVLLVPRKLLIFLVDNFKNKILGRLIKI